MSACWGIVPAAGIGQRMNTSPPKQYLKIGDKYIIEHSVAAMLECQTIHKVVIALHENDAHWQHTHIKDHPHIATCRGGASRALSVRNTLKQLQQKFNAKDEDWVIVHDAVRPCLSATDLEHLIQSTSKDEVGAILAIAINDSIKRAQRVADDSLHVVETVARDNLWVRAATPQMFRYQPLCDALDAALADGLDIDDEAVVMHHAGYEVKIVLGDYRNIKITYREDLENAQFYLGEGQQ